MVDSGYSKEQILGDCATFLVEGFEGLVNHLTWMFHMVAQHPEVQAKVSV